MSKRNRGRHAKGARHAKPSEPIITPVTVGAPVAAAVLSFTATVAVMTPSNPEYVIAPAPQHKAQTTAISAPAAMAHHRSTHAYHIQRGDTLSLIAKRQLGSARQWRAIWWDNRGRVHNPNVITTGHWIRVPDHRWREIWPWLRAASNAAIPHPHAAPAPVANHAPSSPSHVSSGAPGSFEACVISRESGGNPQAVNPSSGAGGLYQFLPSTWAGLGFPGLPQNASVSMQKQAFQKAYAESGVSPWRPYDGC